MLSHVIVFVCTLSAASGEPGPSESTGNTSSRSTLPILTLSQAEAAARRHQPDLAQARARTMQSDAQVSAARAPLLPQLSATVGYQRGTANTSRSGANVSIGAVSGDRSTSYDSYSVGGNLNQLVWDFWQTWDRYRASEKSAEAQLAQERATELDVLHGVRTTFFATRAARDLQRVADETAANQRRHRDQVRAFVEVGTRPEIDLVQADYELATAELGAIRALHAYATSRAQLRRAMGSDESADFEIGEDTMPALGGEDDPVSALLDEALGSRPEVASLRAELAARELAISARRGGYGPSLGIGATVSESGQRLDALVGNWSAAIQLQWPLFSGGATHAAVLEAEAGLALVRAQVAALRQQVRLEVEQQLLAVRGAKAALAVAERALGSATVRLGLAEGRYETGVGTILELGDAQLALTNAGAEKVRAELELATARATLLRALGRVDRAP